MGIKDLLRFMKPYTESIHIEKYSGKRVGIDAYSWLHKGAYSCSMELCLNSEGDKKFQYINYFMHRIKLLRHHKVTPVVVFDGCNVPCKAATEDDRYRRRKANRELAMEKLKEGNVSSASEFFQRAISVTPYMAHQLIQVLRSEKVEFVVAPYEADAQLAYLSSLEEEQGGIVAVISEDSDLLAYGCPAVAFKMDRYGNAQEIVLQKVFSSTNTKPSFRNFSQELFTAMCVLAGCDFLPSVPGIGIVRAYSLVAKYHNIDRVLSILKFEKGNQMPDDYLRSFKEAAAVFQHATIYDQHTKKLKHMKPLSTELLEALDGELDFLGPDIPPSMAIAVARGNINPGTMEAYDSSPSCRISTRQSMTNRTSEQRDETTTEFTETAQIIEERPDTNSTSVAKSCFTVYSSQRTSEDKTPSVESVHRQVLKERNYLNETALLSKLLPPLEFPGTEENSMVYEESSPPLRIPNNNPFRKRKPDEVDDSKPESKTEPKSLVTDDEEPVVLFSTLTSQESVTSTPIKLEGNNIDSGKIIKKHKASCKSSESKKYSILNFFSRA